MAYVILILFPLVYLLNARLGLVALVVAIVLLYRSRTAGAGR